MKISQLKHLQILAILGHRGKQKSKTKSCSRKGYSARFFFLYIIFTAILLKQPQERGKKLAVSI